jgi:hypothetical protein
MREAQCSCTDELEPEDAAWGPSGAPRLLAFHRKPWGGGCRIGPESASTGRARQVPSETASGAAPASSPALGGGEPTFICEESTRS